MTTKQEWMNQRFPLEFSGVTSKPIPLETLRKISERELLEKGIIQTDENIDAYKFTELYVWEKYLLKEWKELGLWERYKSIQFDSVDEFFSYDDSTDEFGYDLDKLYDIMKFFINGSYKSDKILSSVWNPDTPQYQRGSSVFSNFPYLQPTLVYGVSMLMNQIAQHYYIDLFVQKMYEGGKPPLPYFNEKLSYEKSEGLLPRVIEKSFTKEVIHQSNKLFHKKLKKKDCSVAIEIVNKMNNTDFKCENPNKKKFFKNCCCMKIVRELIPLQL